MTKEEKNLMIDNQLKVYEQKRFQWEMTKAALLANGDVDGSAEADKHIEAMSKAYKSVEAMREV